MFIILYLMYIFNSGKKCVSGYELNFILIFILVLLAESQSLTNTIHKTQAAAERPNDMWCYACHSMETGDMCVGNITSNYSSFMKKCKDDEFICMVQKFSYTTSTENATSSAKMWSLERKCAANCEAGCIVIGERTKLYACTSCCRTAYCNTDKGAAKITTTPKNPVETLLITMFVMTVAKLLASPNQYDCWQHFRNWWINTVDMRHPNADCAHDSCVNIYLFLISVMI